jgi:hypothetical protein
MRSTITYTIVRGEDIGEKDLEYVGLNREGVNHIAKDRRNQRIVFEFINLNYHGSRNRAQIHHDLLSPPK